MKPVIIIALIFLVLSIGITPAIQFSDADSTIPSSKLNSDAAFTAATFADKYKDMLFTGNRVSVVIKVVGESENTDPAKRAKEIRYLQSYVLKFLSFSNAVNVVSNQQKNEITAQIDTALIPILEQRSDVISVTVLEVQKDGKEYLDKLPPKKQQSKGRSIINIQCMDNFILIQKYDSSPACVKPLTAEKLIERGWTLSEQTQVKVFEKLVDSNARLSITPDEIANQRYLVIEGFGWHRLHNVEITISSQDFLESIRSKTTDRGDLYTLWQIPDSAGGKMYNIFATDGIHEFELDIPIAINP